MLYVYLFILLALETSAMKIGCISNITFISAGMTIILSQLTFDQCACHQWLENYSGFNYFTNNETCQLFENFTTDYTLQVNTQTRFCFNNPPLAQIPCITTDVASTPLDTTDSMSSIAPTTTLLDITTPISGLKWNSTGIIVASGNGNSSILNPYAVFVDEQYYIYIAEKGNSRISKWPPNPNGLASSAIFRTASGELNQPPSLYVNSRTGGIYVADELNHRVKFFPNGSTTGVNVTGALSGTLPTVNGIYLDPNGTIFITDTGNNRIYNWFTNQTVAGGNGAGANANQLSSPKRFFIDSDYSFYLTDSSNSRVQKWLKGATSGQTVAGGYGAGSNASQLSGPLGVVVDSQGNVLVCDSTNIRIQKWAPGATVGETIASNSSTTSGLGSSQMASARGIAVDKDNNLYVADATNLQILKFNAL